jgi:hypothetical protein
MVSVPALSSVDRGLYPQSSKPKDYSIGVCCVSAKHAALRRENKNWLARNHYKLFRSRQHVPTGQSADVVQKLGGRVVVDVTVVVGVVVAVVVAEVGVVVPDCVVVDDIGIMI